MLDYDQSKDRFGKPKHVGKSTNKLKGINLIIFFHIDLGCVFFGTPGTLANTNTHRRTQIYTLTIHPAALKCNIWVFVELQFQVTQDRLIII